MTDLALQLTRGKVTPNEPMARHTTWRLGGPADLFVEPGTVEELLQTLGFARTRSLPVTVVGNGSNLLVGDRGIRGLVIKIGSGMGDIKVDGNRIRSGAGARLARVQAAALDAGLGGLEFSVGIPASLGGAVVMNAGANGGCIGNLVESVTTVDYYGNLSHLSRDDCQFTYRHSVLQDRSAIVVDLILECFPKSRDLIKQDMQAYMRKRKSSQPIEYPSAGSVFKNPPGESAGRLIDLAGAKGMRVGDAQVSEKHANFIVNRGKATAGDVLALIARVREMVNARFGIELELEVKLLGEH